MNIIYLASVRIPNEKASGLAIMRQCEAFARNGHTVTLLRPHRINHITDEPFAYYGLPSTFKIITMKSITFMESLGMVGFFITRLSQMCASFIYIMLRRKHIQIVYARDPWLLVLPVLCFRHIPIVWEAHQMQMHPLVTYVARKATRVVCISRGLQTAYSELTNRNDILHEPSGVDTDQFNTVPSIEGVRRTFNIPERAQVIGYIGKYSTMGESKGVDELIEAFASIKVKFPTTHLLIVGLEAHERAMVKEFSMKWGLGSGDMTLLPLEQKHFAHYVQAADILVMNYPDVDHYRHYMSPTKLFAYLASGKLVVASDLPTVREIADQTILIYTLPSNLTALKSALSRALSVSTLERDTFVVNAQNCIQSYTWQARGDRILASLKNK